MARRPNQKTDFMAIVHVYLSKEGGKTMDDIVGYLVTEYSYPPSRFQLVKQMNIDDRFKASKFRGMTTWWIKEVGDYVEDVKKSKKEVFLVCSSCGCESILEKKMIQYCPQCKLRMKVNVSRKVLRFN